MPALATELTGRQVTVLAATGSILSALAAKTATTTIPIVFLVAEDPVRVGLVTVPPARRQRRGGGKVSLYR